MYIIIVILCICLIFFSLNQTFILKENIIISKHEKNIIMLYFIFSVIVSIVKKSMKLKKSLYLYVIDFIQILNFLIIYLHTGSFCI